MKKAIIILLLLLGIGVGGLSLLSKQSQQLESSDRPVRIKKMAPMQKASPERKYREQKKRYKKIQEQQKKILDEIEGLK